MKYFIAILFLSSIFSTRAYNLNVIVRYENNTEKVSKLRLDALRTNYTEISNSIEIEDSTYMFYNLPNDTIIISFAQAGHLIEKLVTTPTERIIFKIPKYEMTQQLSNVTVEADKQFISNDKIIFIPAQNEKMISSGGIALLQNMAIPSVYISPIDNSIKTPDGDGIATYIDYLPATQADLSNIRTMDVSRVEVYEYPSDPRFGGARHVVNIILRKYEYGGYTTIRGQQGFIDNRGNYNVASKFTYKKMTYDIAGGYNYSRNKHIGELAITNFDFPSGQITRYEAPIKGLYNNHNTFASLRSIIQTNKNIISNSIGINSNKQPNCYQLNSTLFSSDLYSSGTSEKHSDSNNYSIYWNGKYSFFLPNNLAFIITPSISFGEFEQNYNSTDGAVTNDVTETAWNYNLETAVRKKIKAYSFAFTFSTGGNWNDLSYTGTTPANVLTKEYYGGARISANLRFDKAWLQGNLGLWYNYTKINSQHKNDLTPQYFFAAGYNFNAKNRISLSSELSHWTIPLSQQSDNMKLLNQIDAIQGNPNLKTYKYNSVKSSYQWLPSNNFSLSFYCGFFRFTNPINYIYEPIDILSKQMMVRKFINCGFLNNWNYGSVASLRLLNNSIVLRSGVSRETISVHGIEQTHHSDFISYNGIIQYSKNGFWVQFVYQSKGKNMSTTATTKTPQFYSFLLGWGNGNLNIAFKVLNPFNSSWDGAKYSISTNNYNYISQSCLSKYHRAFELSASYSFSYGKKVKQDDLQNNGPTVNSAILE